MRKQRRVDQHHSRKKSRGSSGPGRQKKICWKDVKIEQTTGVGPNIMHVTRWRKQNKNKIK